MHLVTHNKKVMNIKAILIILMLLPCFAFAQSEQLQREIRIAEGILQELFADQPGSEHPFVGTRSSRVSSDYIPGYGVHFQIGDNPLAQAVRVSREIRVIQRDGNHTNARTEQDSGNDSELIREAIEQKMTEYFTQYAPLLQNLPDEEFVRLSTGVTSRQGNVIISLSGENRSHPLPKITKWVQKRELNRFREGSITEQQLIQRIQTADLSETEEKRDFNIFKTILDTAANNTGLEYLRFRSSPYTYLPGFGVQFHLNASSRGAFILGMDFETPVIRDFNFDFDTTKNPDMAIDIQKNLAGHGSERFTINVDSLRWVAGRSLDSLRVAMDDMAISLRNIFPEERKQPEDGELTREKEKLYNEFLQTITEYGSTLSSLPDNEFLIVAITWPSRSTELPQKTYIRIKMRDLAAGRTPEIQEIERN